LKTATLAGCAKLFPRELRSRGRVITLKRTRAPENRFTWQKSAYSMSRVGLTIAIELALTVLLIFGGEAIGASYLYSTRKNVGLLWAPDSRIEHATVEFHYITRVNNFGFRGADMARSHPGGRRIVVIGDSFTYGWGLSFEESWPRLLEVNLRARGLQVEVANLGYPGAGPEEYSELAPRALATLHPDVVIVAILQADDLLQCDASSSHADPAWWQHLGSAAARLFPALSQLIRFTRPKQLHVTAQDLREIWRKQVRDFVASMNAEERARYDRLPAMQRNLYALGDLNPGLLYRAVHDPSFMLETCDLQRESTRREMVEMGRRLGQIRDAAANYRAQVMVASVPQRVYVSARELETMHGMGFQVDSTFLRSDCADATIRRAAEIAHLPFWTATEWFRNRSRDTSLYFPMDGHFNAAGAREYASWLSSKLP
jgi:lysophospholipase L1-like esterase